MPKCNFDVTYEIVTPESAENGDAEERGYIGQSLTLREAIYDVLHTRTSLVEGIEAIEFSSSDLESARWLDVCNGAEFETDARENRSLHFPEHLTASTKRRIMRLIMKS